MQRRPVDELVGELVVVLHAVHQLHRFHAELERLAQRQPQELGVPRRERVVVGGPADEVVGQVGADRARVADVLDREVELLEGEAADLAHHAGDEWFAAWESGCPSDHAGRPSALFSTPRKPFASSRSAPDAEVAQRVQGVADHQPHAREGRVEPVDRRLALLEVVQVHPPPV